jgi:WD40 repeat protein
VVLCLLAALTGVNRSPALPPQPDGKPTDGQFDGQSAWLNKVCVAVRFGPKDAFLAAMADDGVYFFNPEKRALASTHNQDSSSGVSLGDAISPTGSVVSHIGLSDLRLINLSDRVAASKTIDGVGTIRCAAFAPDRQTLLLATGPKAFQLWNLDPLKKEWSLSLEKWEQYAISLAPTADGNTVVVGGSEGGLATIDLCKRTVLKAEAKLHRGYVDTVAVTADGKLAATGSFDGTAKIWKVADLSLHCAVTSHRGTVSAVAFSPDGKFLASGGADGILCITDVEKKEIHRLFRLPDKKGVNALAFSHDGKMLAVASRQLYVLDTTSWTEIPPGK